MKIAFRVGMLFENGIYMLEPNNFWLIWNILEANLPKLKDKTIYGIS